MTPEHTHNNEATNYSWTISELEKEIAWNEQRLVNLVWGEDDRRQTEDYIADLKKERQRLLGMPGSVLVPVKSLWDMNASWYQPPPCEEAGLVKMKENTMGDEDYHIDGVLTFGVVKNHDEIPVFCSQCVEGRAGNGQSIFVIVEWNLVKKLKRVSNEEFNSQMMALVAYHANDLTWSEWK